MRIEEEKAAELFKEYLQKLYSNVDYKPGSDPPDIVFEVDGYKWAVEHTRLFEYIDKDGKEISRLEIDQHIIDLENQLNKSLKNNLNSGWIISLYSPIKKKELKTIEEQIRKVIDEDLDKVSFRHTDGKVYMEKIVKGENQIILISIPSPLTKIPHSDKFTFDIQGQVDFSFKKILNDKCHKMARLKNYDKKILLIENQYMFTTRENINKSLSKSKSQIEGLDEIWILNKNEIYKL